MNHKKELLRGLIMVELRGTSENLNRTPSYTKQNLTSTLFHCPYVGRWPQNPAGRQGLQEFCSSGFRFTQLLTSEAFLVQGSLRVDV